MLLWLIGTVHSAVCLHSESREHPLLLVAGQRNKPPCSILDLPKELSMKSRSRAERAFSNFFRPRRADPVSRHA
jgi:hypothetical protein